MYNEEYFNTLIEKEKKEGFTFPNAGEVNNFERLVRFSAEKKDFDKVFGADDSNREVPKAAAKIDKASGRICMFPADSEVASAVKNSGSITDVRRAIKSVLVRRVSTGYANARKSSL